VTLFEDGADQPILGALEHALADYETRCFRNSHVTYRQLCEIQDEHGYRNEDEFPPECFPLRQDAWVALLGQFEHALGTLPAPLVICVWLGFALRALERQVEDRCRHFGRWEHWPSPDTAPHPLDLFRQQLRRLRTLSPAFGRDADPAGFDLTEVSYRRRRQPQGTANYQHWVLATCRELVDRAVNDPGLARAVADAVAARPEPDAEAPRETDRVSILGDAEGGASPLRLTASGNREFIPRGTIQQAILEQLVAAECRRVRTSNAESSLVDYPTLNSLVRGGDQAAMRSVLPWIACATNWSSNSAPPGAGRTSRRSPERESA
jgi:hypothetical protein